MTSDDTSRMSGEDRLIAEYFRPLARAPGAMDLRDDAAFFTPPAGHDLVLTKDALVAGVHFFADDPPATIAQKALRVNLSDLAAKGAEPKGFLLALALPDAADAPWLKSFSEGLGRDALTYDCPLFGGDTVKTPGPLTISITAFGVLPRGTMVHREGAKAGDAIFVSGTIGDAALGLALRRDGALAAAWGLDPAEAAFLIDAYRVPRPRIRLALAVRRHASAAMDVSDGLAGDLAKLCSASGVSAIVDGRVPLSDAAAACVDRDSARWQTIVSGGDDYEILCAIPPAQCDAFIAAASMAGIAVHQIGRVVAGDDPPQFRDSDGAPIELGATSFSHF
jgi:thiamine-monophosphate kinase